jgi:hypothetical protein
MTRPFVAASTPNFKPPANARGLERAERNDRDGQEREGSSVTRASSLVDRVQWRTKGPRGPGLPCGRRLAQTPADFPTLSEQGLPEPIVFCRRAGSERSAASPVADPVVKIKLYENLGGAAGLGTNWRVTSFGAYGAFGSTSRQPSLASTAVAGRNSDYRSSRCLTFAARRPAECGSMGL